MYTPAQSEVSSDGPINPIIPTPPSPSNDKGMKMEAKTGQDSVIPRDDQETNIFTLAPIAALKMLCDAVEDLVRITGDVPPTPPVSYPSTPIAQSTPANGGKRTQSQESMDKLARSQSGVSEDRDIPAASKTPIGSPEAHPTEPYHIIGSDTEPIYIQHGAISRKFYSKKPPPISLEEYLLRLHRYCPMSTAVYLATSLYIHRLAIIERSMPVTIRNVHRLLLAGLRVAMKALEDLSYPHRRFAKVGGVSEPELGRLEVSFCFLTNFELKVDENMLLKQVLAMRNGAKFKALPPGFQPVVPASKRIPVRTVIPQSAPEVSD